MPKPRSKANQGLPTRWRNIRGVYYYDVPEGQEHHWDGKKLFRLGDKLHEASRTWTERLARVAGPSEVRNIGDLLDRYAREVIPKKAPASQTSNMNQLPKIREVFGAMPLLPFKPQWIYQFVDARSIKKKDPATGRVTGGKIAAHREIELLSHAYTKAVEWGYIDRHPFKNEVRLEGEASRDRYVEDWEVIEALSLVPRRKSGSVLMIQAYLRIKLLTGMAQGDLLRLQPDVHFKDDGIHVQRHKTKTSSGILYVGAGVSGGEEGALRGPALMPGGDARAWPVVRPLLQAIAARAEDGEPCCDWIGAGGSGHFVKMVHNGIEYADMQTLCEAYWLMRELAGLSAGDMAGVFGQWNEGELASYLVGITADILERQDEDTGQPLVDLILDTAQQKGTGKWTSQVALDLGVPAPTIADAVFARAISAVKSERVAASQVLAGAAPRAFAGEQGAFVEQVRRALLAAKVCAYAQGFALLRAADQEHGWGLSFGGIAAGWRAGCIIRARLLEDIRRAFAREPQLANLLLDPHFAEVMARCQQDLREVVATAAMHGVAVPAFMSALAWYDAYRSARLPANLLQAQRDYFGAHTYERTDRPGRFHTRWTD